MKWVTRWEGVAGTWSASGKWAKPGGGDGVRMGHSILVSSECVSEFDTSSMKEKRFPLCFTAIFLECPSYFVWKVDEVRERKAP